MATAGSNRLSDRNGQAIAHVMGEGWYVETNEGVQGPFATRQAAERLLAQASFPRAAWSSPECWQLEPV